MTNANALDTGERIQFFQPGRHKWTLLMAVAVFCLLKFLWDGVQFIGRIPPDGQAKIVYLSCPKGTIHGEIYSMNLDGSEKTLLLRDPDKNIHLERPVIRPDRKQIAFYMRRNYQQSIWTMSLDGSRAKRITGWAPATGSPTYTPDGRNLLFSYLPRAASDTPSEVFTMNTKGKRWRHLGRYMNNKDRLEIAKVADPQGPWIIGDSSGDWFRPISQWAKILHANGKTFPLPAIA